MSIKRAMAIQYAIDNGKKLGISENIVLCDSDIIIFKDLDFLKQDMLYQGFETNSEDDDLGDGLNLCLCHINRKLIKEYGIDFFNPEKMFRSSFYNEAHLFLNTQHIDIFKYCHFIPKPYKDTIKYDIKTFPEQFIENDFRPFILNRFDFTDRTDKIYNTIKEKYGITETKAKNVIYTCITSGYDEIYEQDFYDFDNFDYVCFTNSDDLKSDNWRIVNVSGIEEILGMNDQTKLARFFKTHPHIFLSNYERSIWIDGNIRILEKNLKDNFLTLLDEESYFLIAEHPYITNVYFEIDKCLELKKDTVEELERIRSFLQNEKFNDMNEHVQSGIILRNHNHKSCIAIMEKWWEMIRDFSRRDQTSFNYAIRKMHGRFLSIPWAEMETRFFKIERKHKKKIKY